MSIDVQSSARRCFGTVSSGGAWSRDFEVAGLEQFLDNPQCPYKGAKTHRASRVDFTHGDVIFPVRAANDVCDRRAERCKSLCEAFVCEEPDSGIVVSDGVGACPGDHRVPDAGTRASSSWGKCGRACSSNFG